MIDGRNFFDQPINSMTKTYKNIRKIATCLGDDYTTGCLLDYFYFKDHCKMLAIDLSKQQALDVNPRTIHKMNFMANLDREGNKQCSLLLKKQKKLSDFSQGMVKVL